MRPRVTLQLPRSLAEPRHKDLLSARDLDGAKVLLIGRGYVARALEPHLRGRGADIRHTVRDAADPQSLGSAATRRAFEAADIVLVSVPPTRDGSDPALAALSGATSQARWIGYLSATSVYGDRDGHWAFEGEAPTPSLPRGARRADAELGWLCAFPQTQLFRLAGIYGPGRAPFARIEAGSARVVDVPGHVVNRIHVDDIVAALMASIARPCAQDILNLADGQPAPPGDVLDFAASLLGRPAPPRVGLDDPSVSAMARSFYAETKRIDIGRAEARLGWRPTYPDYKSGLRATLSAERAREPYGKGG